MCPAMNRPHNLSRRVFVGAAAGALGLPWLAAACGGQTNTALGPGPVAQKKMGTLLGFGEADKSHFFIGAVDLDATGRPVREQRDINFLGHGFAPNPQKPHLAVISQKHGRGAVEWDMRARKVTRGLDIPPGRQFYGHGAFTPDGKTLFLVESVVGDKSYDGVISVRDGDSYEITGHFPSYGLAPHDVLLIDDGRMLVITNGGGLIGTDELPCVTYVDVKTRELKRKLTFTSPRINAGHLAMTSRGDLVVISAPREGLDVEAADVHGAISFYSPGGEVRTPDHSVLRRMRRETLSAAIHEPTMTVCATSPYGNMVTFWDFRRAALIKAIDEFVMPRGVSLTLDGRYFALTYDQATHAVLIDARSLEVARETTVDQTFISGSHNYIYEMPL